MKKPLFLVVAILSIQYLFAQNYPEQMSKAAEALQKKDYCAALTIFKTAFADTTQIGTYDLFYAALAATNCHSEKEALLWLKKSQQKGLGLNPGEITYIENDSSFMTLHAYNEWTGIITAMKTALAQKQELIKKKTDTWLQQLQVNRIPQKQNGRFNKAKAGFALYYTTVDSLQVPYIVYVPKAYNPAKPVQAIVYLHGGVGGVDSFGFRNHDLTQEPIFSAADTLNALVIYPFGRKDFGWLNQQKAFENIFTITKNVQQAYNINSRRMFLGGMSNGGSATFWFASQPSTPFSGFFAFSAIPTLKFAAINFANLAHGKPLYSLNAKDDQVFKYKEVLAIYTANKAAAKDWYFETLEKGDHGFIYDPANGKQIMIGLLKKLLMK